MRRGKKKQPTVILDRDGVINKEGIDYVKNWDEFEFLPGVLEALAILHRQGVRTLVATNQSCVGRGIISRADLEEIHTNMLARIRDAGGYIEKIYVCPCRPEEGCSCRKPLPGMLEEASRDFDLDLGECFFVGDAQTDISAGRRAGCRTVLVLTGKGADTLKRVENGETEQPDMVAEDLPAAVKALQTHLFHD
ncbi:MAG: D-glycero-beta-D-manno-heptose 1,7-bisphosphate 7-phosphatase [Deltaproteobacteria bacterium]|nr:D-glycero-beta-D-manno-heptose 1,7-bisphosphate 7-phosphatase [Deltaproteobacteria bacterium]